VQMKNFTASHYTRKCMLLIGPTFSHLYYWEEAIKVPKCKNKEGNNFFKVFNSVFFFLVVGSNFYCISTNFNYFCLLDDRLEVHVVTCLFVFLSWHLFLTPKLIIICVLCIRSTCTSSSICLCGCYLDSVNQCSSIIWYVLQKH